MRAKLHWDNPEVLSQMYTDYWNELAETGITKNLRMSASEDQIRYAHCYVFATPDETRLFATYHFNTLRGLQTAITRALKLLVGSHE